MIPANDRKFVLTVVLIAILIKCTVMIAYFYLWLLPGNMDVIGPDGEQFSQLAWYQSRVLKGKADYEVPTNEWVFRRYYAMVDYYKGELIPFQTRGIKLFTWFITIVYYLFGYVPLLIKTFNIFFSTLSSILLFRLALEISNRQIAKISLILFTFFPTIFMFSITMLRDPLIILCIIAILYMMIKLNKSLNIKPFMVLIPCVLLVLFLRQVFFPPLIVWVSIVLLINKRAKYKILVVLITIIIMLLVTNIDLFSALHYRADVLAKNIAPIMFSLHAARYFFGGTYVYRIFPHKYYEVFKKYDSRIEYLDSQDKIKTLEFVKYVPNGIFMYFFSPFPFEQKGLLHHFISVYMLWWYVIIGLSFFGIFNTQVRPIYPFTVYICIIVLMSSMAYGNAGILLRHRDSIVPFFILFASCGIDKFKRYFISKSGI